MQTLQEQDKDLPNPPPLRRQASLPGTSEYEHCRKNVQSEKWGQCEKLNQKLGLLEAGDMEGHMSLVSWLG